MYRIAEKGKMKGGSGDGEIEMLLNEIPYATSMNYLHHHLMMNASSPSPPPPPPPPVGGNVSSRQSQSQYSPSSSFSGGFFSPSPPVGSVSNSSRQSQFSPSSSFSGGFCSSDDISPSQTPFEDYTTHQAPNTSYVNRLWVESKSPDSSGLVNKSNEQYMLYEQALSEYLYRMNIRGDEQKDCANITQFQGYPDGFGFGNGSFIPCNVEKYDPSQAVNNGGLDFGGFPSPFHKVPMGCDVSVESALLRLRPGCKAGNSMESSLTHYQSNALYSDPRFHQNQMYHLLEQNKEQGSNGYHRGVQLYNPSSVTGPYINNDPSVCSRQYELTSAVDRSVLPQLNSNSTLLMHPKQALNAGNSPCNGSMFKGRTKSISNCEVPQSYLSMRGTPNLEGFSCEDSYIIQENSLNHVSNKGVDRLKGQRKSSCNGIATRTPRTKSLELSNRTQFGVAYENGSTPMNQSALPLLPNYSSLGDIQGCIYFLAKDQNGCRFLQRLFDEGTRQDVQIIFNEIIDHIVELMTNPFGNYLVQKLFDVCNEEQRTQITRMVTAVPGELVKISLNTHGTRSVQKLIETLNTRQQISLIISALAPGFLDLIKDLNGNHVVQRCLQSFSNEHNKLIFDAATKFCADIATHRHGCCVLQKCVAHSFGGFRDKLVGEISANALRLAQDPFGNYVVQYIIEMKIPSANAILNSQFEGNYAYLSMQKFSSHVVEKCLRFIEESRAKIINELMSVSHFEQMLQDPFANYVIQSALEVTKGNLHAMLVEAVRPHTILRTSPYCKRIFSRNLLRK